MFLPHIGHMQKGSLVQTDVDESRLHARQDPGHFAQVHIAHQTALQRAFDVQLLHGTKFDHRDPGFLGRPIDQNILLHGWNQVEKWGRLTACQHTRARGTDLESVPSTAQQRTPKVRSKRAVSKSGRPMMPE